MSEEQFKSLFSMINKDADLRDRISRAENLDTVVQIAREAGFDVCKADWLRYEYTQALKLSDADLERLAGGQRLPQPIRGDTTSKCESYNNGREWMICGVNDSDCTTA